MQVLFTDREEIPEGRGRYTGILCKSGAVLLSNGWASDREHTKQPMEDHYGRKAQQIVPIP